MPAQTAVDPRQRLDTLATVTQSSHPPGAVAPAGVPGSLGPFQILGVLGEGGSGVVYAARWGHREVALKVLHPTIIATDRERTRFFSEAKLLAEVTHPSVVKVLNVGALPDGRPYLAMEKLDGETLAARLSRGAIPVDSALALFDQIAGAVAALHRGGLIHRDLKPENVVLTGSGQFAVLLDFGIAKELDAPASTVTQDGGVRGTPAYMAPERFFGQPANPRTDIYELGVLLYAMVTGALPWADHADPTARLNPRRPSDIGVALPGRLEAELLVALSTRPESRPASVGELMQRLVQAYQDAPSGSARRTADISSPRRQAEQAAQMPQAPGARVTPIGAGHKNHVTPLAHASTVHAPHAGPAALHTTDTAHKRRKTWPIAIAVVVSAVGIAGGTWFALRGNSQPTVAAAPSGSALRDAGAAHAEVQIDATAAMKPPPTPTTVTDGTKTLVPPRKGDDTGLATAHRYHPTDTRMLIGIRVRELLRSKAVGPLLLAQRDNPKLDSLAVFKRLCSVDFLTDIDWITLGVTDMDSQEFDLSISGNWDRDKIESCLSKSAAGGKKLVRHGSLTYVPAPQPTWIGWIDDRTLFYTTRSKVTKSWMQARMAGKKGLASVAKVAQIVTLLDTMSTVWLIGDPQEVSSGALMKGIPDPTTIYGGLTITDALTGDVGMLYANTKSATTAKTKIAAELKKLRADPIGEMVLGKTTILQDKRTVAIAIRLDRMMTSVVTMAVGEALKKQ